MDILDMVYDALIAETYIKDNAEGRIKFYEYPETGDVSGVFVVIDPVDPPTPIDFADNKWTKLDYYLQIDVWSRDLKLTDSIADKIRDVIWNQFGFRQTAGPKEYDQGVFRDARRYRGSLYIEDFNNL
ncbi:hypothetical protein Pryu01_01229 [Paraliobacillus ryukyuensis]|uniref:DUF3168 domain-containing protein n=1 Tax=Paraliobacillus ryukyuensis TaxID=200904 RepID=A0A366EB32_9BACI|nr:DUF3168 domain-containing protein [Paraliobacillus ryukyuensis]RBO99537.1 hypothetical protein DES48_104213 [Paraliobacillus ryukyuensis]